MKKSHIYTEYEFISRWREERGKAAKGKYNQSKSNRICQVQSHVCFSAHFSEREAH